MNIFPAIDLFGGQAVRLFKGDYAQMTVYSDDPVGVARSFRAAGAEYLHVVDLEGAKDGTTANFDMISAIIKDGGLKTEVGGGIRSMEVIERYVSAGVFRVILGTAAITQPGFVRDAVARFGSAIAVGVDIKDGLVAIKGWTEVSDRDALSFCSDMQSLGVETIISTDISKDGVLGGTNTGLYEQLSQRLSLQIIASGGVSTLDDVRTLAGMNLYGAILGKALYTGALDLAAAIVAAREAGCGA